MANFVSIAAAGRSVERLLNSAFTDSEPVPGRRTRAILVRTEDFNVNNNAGTLITYPALSIWLYRVDFNKTMRAAWSAVGHHEERAYLPLDLHYLITAWAENAEFEHRILGRAMQCLEATPILTGPLLPPDADWAPNEGVQITMDEITTEAVMRTFDSLPTDYRLSIPYMVRVVRIEAKQPATKPVTKVIVGKTASAKP